MKFSLDTSDYRTINLAITDADIETGMANTMAEFCYAMASIYTTFALQIGLDKELSRSFKNAVFISVLDRNIEMLLDEEVLEVNEDDIEDSLASNLQDELSELKKQLERKDFSPEEISAILEYVSACSSVGSALDHLLGINTEETNNN